MRKLTGILLGMILCASCANAQDIEKIKELQALGFTNEQIVEMMNESNQKSTAQVNEPSNGVAPEIEELMYEAKKNKQGIVVVFASKENVDQGPGYLNITAKSNKEKIQLDPIPILEYSLEGQKGAAVTTVKSSSYSNTNVNGNAYANTYANTYGNNYNSTTMANFNANSWTNSFNMTQGVTYVPDIITSRYLGKYVLPEGVYEFELSRNFITGNHGILGNDKTIRHKKFHKVEVEAGKVTIISYYWQDNAAFGLDQIMSKNHKIVENNLAFSFGPYLKYVKIQHNK